MARRAANQPEQATNEPDASAEEGDAADESLKEAPRGMKAQWIREELGKNAGLMPKSIAERLNDRAKREGYDVEFSAQEVSVEKGKQRKSQESGGSQGGAAKRGEEPTSRATRGTRGTPPAAASRLAASAGGAPANAAGTSTSEVLSLVKQVKALIRETGGADNLKALIDELEG